VTVFLGWAGERSLSASISKIGQLMPIVSETDQIADRQNFSLNSRAQISDGSARRFFGVSKRRLL